MIDLTVHEAQIEKNAQLCARQGILLPTYKEMADPDTVSAEIKEELKGIGLNQVHSRNLYRLPSAGNVGAHDWRTAEHRLDLCAGEAIAPTGKHKHVAHPVKIGQPLSIANQA